MKCFAYFLVCLGNLTALGVVESFVQQCQSISSFRPFCPPPSPARRPFRRTTSARLLLLLSRGNSDGDFFNEIEDDDEIATEEDEEEGGDDGEDKRAQYASPSDVSHLTNQELFELRGGWDENMPNWNRVVLTGRVGQDPDPRYFDDGKVVVNLGLACKRQYHPMEWRAKKMKPGDEETDWYALTIWGQNAEFVSKYVTKGARIGVSGTLEFDSYKDKATGQMNLIPKVIVNDVELLETKAESELRRSKQRQGQSFYNSNDSYNDNSDGDGDDDDDDDDDDDFGPFSAGSFSAGSGGFFDD